MRANALIEQMRLASLRVVLMIALANAVVLTCIVLLTGGTSVLARTILAGGTAIVLGAWPLYRAKRLDEDIKRMPWLPVLWAAIGGLVLALDPQGHHVLFAAFLTPVGICVLYGERRKAILAALAVIAGYAVASVEPGAHEPFELAISDVLPVPAVIVGGLAPVVVAFSTITLRSKHVAEWRASDATTPSPVARPGQARAHDQAILDGVRVGKTDAFIAKELGLTRPQIRDRRQRLQHEHGAEDREHLARMLFAKWQIEPRAEDQQ